MEEQPFLDMDGWMGETVFSLMKIINRECFGVYVSARKFPNMIKEFMKVHCIMCLTDDLINRIGLPKK